MNKIPFTSSLKFPNSNCQDRFNNELDTSNYSQSTLSKSYLPDVVEGQCRRIIRCITRGMDSRNERNLLISRHSPLAYIRNRIPLVFSSLSLVRLFVHVQISSISAPFFPVILACITSPLPLPFLASYYLVAKSFLCFHLTISSPPSFLFRLAFPPTHTPSPFHFESYSPEDNDENQGGSRGIPRNLLRYLMATQSFRRHF